MRVDEKMIENPPTVSSPDPNSAMSQRCKSSRDSGLVRELRSLEGLGIGELLLAHPG
jgi:hypothetical protein